MRILMTTDTIGGVWTFTRELAEGLLRAGHSVALISFGRMPSPQQQAWIERTLLFFSSTFCYVSSEAPLEWMHQNTQALAAAEPGLLALARSFQPDVLHSSQFCFGSLPLDIPKVITAHSDVLSWAAACRPHGLEPSQWLATYSALVQTGLAQADVVAAPTAAMLADLKTNFSLPHTTTIIPNGRSLHLPVHTGQRLAQAVSTGRIWDEAKGLSTLARVQSPVPILIAGESSFEGHEATVEPSSLRTLGLLAEPELMELFQQSSVYLAASLYEPFGLAPLEAALCGCAIVARDLPSFREVWGSAALYFSDNGELERLLRKLFAAPNDLLVAQSAALNKAQQYTAERTTAAYISLYHDALQQTRPTTERLVCHAA